MSTHNGNSIDILNTSIKVNDTINFDYSGRIINFTLSKGKYLFECWGAGGPSGNATGGNGAYTKGILTIDEQTDFNCMVGALGSKAYGGWTGPVFGNNAQCYSEREYNTVGGGATDFGIGHPSTTWNDITRLRSRIMVAAAGGGSGTGNGVHAGELNGVSAGGGNQNARWGQGGTQTHGGAAGVSRGGNPVHITLTAGSFGSGGNGSGALWYGGAGSAGWYGGGGSGDVGGASGSCFISGYPGCNAITQNGTHTNQSIHWSGLSFENPTMLGYAKACPNPRNNDASMNGNNTNGYARITLLELVDDDKATYNVYIQNLNREYVLYDTKYIEYNGNFEFVPLNLEGMTFLEYEKIVQNDTNIINSYYTRNSYNLTVIGGTSSQYTYLFEEQGDLQYTREYFNDPLSKFKHWTSDDNVEIYSAFLKDTTFKMPAYDITIYAESTDQDRVNTNIYKNIFENILFDLYEIQNNITGVYKQENTIFQYKHNFDLYDLVYRDNNGLYKKGLANEEQYGVIGIISKIVNANEFVLLTFGQIEIDYNFSSDSGILYLSDTEPGKFCTYEELTTNFYTPIGFYTGNTITLNILDSSVGDVLKKYHDQIYDQETFAYLTEPEKQDIIQEVLNNA